MRVVILVLETHRDVIVMESPEFFDEPVVLFVFPLAREELDDGCAALEEFRAVAPAAVLGVRKRNSLWVAAVPSVFGHADFLSGGF